MLQHIGLPIVHGCMLIIKFDLIVAEDNVICRYGVNQRYTVGEERIAFNEDILVIAHLLVGRLLNLRINGDDALCELVTLDEVVVKQVVDNLNIQAAATLVPALGIAR